MAHEARAGTSAVTPHTTHAWWSLPASKLRPVQRIQPVRASWTKLLRGKGFSCSTSSANKTAKKLMCRDDSGELSRHEATQRESGRGCEASRLSRPKRSSDAAG